MTRIRRAVLLDLDGTLVDTAPDFHAVLNRLRQEEGLPPLAYAAVRAEVSNGGGALIRLGFGVERGTPEFAALLERLLAHYSAHIADHSRLFPGMAPLLDWLEQRRWPWGVVTNKPQRFAQPLLEQLGLARRCGALVCPEQVAATKPDPEGLLLACRQLGCDPALSVYAGDHVRDIEAGRNAGLLTASALFGYLEPRAQPQQWGANYNARSAGDLLAWLQTLDQPSTGTRHV